MEMEGQQASHVQALPEDMLADVLRCLVPRSLAACRCVCKAWHAVIDGHRLLRAELLPLSMSGIFINFRMLGLPEFFSCAGTATTTTGRAAVSGDLISYAPNDTVVGHCNGLLLRYRSVVNPATRQWAPLPRLAPPCAEKLPSYPYLAFDPAISPHYEVFLLPVVPSWWFKPRDNDPVTRVRSADWPPSLWETLVLSSRTGRWEERSFVRQGEPAGTMADMAQADSGTRKHYSVYWHGALYVHSRNNFFCRISLATNEYQVIKPPLKNGRFHEHECYLGRSEKGVYCAILDHKFQFRVWVLDESSSGYGRQMKWVLKHRNNLKKVMASVDYSCQPHDGGAWSFEDINYYDGLPEEKHRDNGHQDGSDDDKEPPVKPEITDRFYITILGLHPFKEIVYLSNYYSTGLAYHLDGSKVQYLGNMCPKLYGVIAGQHADIEAAFPYTPCWKENSFITSST